MPKQENTCTVTQKKLLTPTTFALSFRPEPSFEFKAGQFISVIIPGAGPGGRNLRRAYSIASRPEDSDMELCIKRVKDGPGTTFLDHLKVGESFQALAPYGDFVYRTEKGRTPCFVATGTGLAPFRAILTSNDYLKHPADNAICLFGTTTKDEILYREELSKIQHLDFRICLSREKSVGDSVGYFRGRVTRCMNFAIPDWNLSQMDFYLCGNGTMIKEVKETLFSRGVEKKRIFQEKYY